MNRHPATPTNKHPAVAAALYGCGPALLALAAQLAAAPQAWSQTAPTSAGAPHHPMTQEAEIALALSACPALVANKAAVYVLRDSGYVKVRESQNGFSAIVQHSSPTAQEPQCIDAEGTRTVLQRYLKVAELRAQGKSPEEIKHFVADAYKNGTLQIPAHPGIDYMLSTQNYVPNNKGGIGHFPPHVMFYAPYKMNAEIGADDSETGPVFVAGEGTPGALMIVPLGDREAHVHPAEDSQPATGR